MNAEAKTGTETVACLLWAGVQTGIRVEEKSFPTREEATGYVRALRRRGRTSWLKGDKRYTKVEAP